MGLRRGDAAPFFMPCEDTATMLVERARWLAQNAHEYAALLPQAEPALADTIALANTHGIAIDTSLSAWHQLLALGRAWQCDFAWLHAEGAGEHRVIGGCVCFPSSWALRDKLGKTMTETHAPVPALNDAMGSQIETFFSKMIPGAVWVRENANFSRVPARNQHPAQSRPPLDATVSAGDFWIRLEHQLLLKLPASRSILFAIRVETFPLTRVMESPADAERLACWLESMPADAADYKSVAEARKVIVPLLRVA